jgi:cytochrome c peroxidase
MNKLTRSIPWILGAIVCLLVTLSTGGDRLLPQPASATLGPPPSVMGERPIEPIPTALELDLTKVALGDKLYHDPQLSHDNNISCASCHLLDLGGSDRRTHSVGIKGQVGLVNAPTVLNSAFHFKQFWDGRADSLEEQIDGPINNPKEMGSNWSEVVEKLQKSPQYPQEFQKVYPDGITSNNIKNAIAVFERSLVTPNSRFDRFLGGDNNALTAEEKRGYDKFKDFGCVSCHQGILLGGNLFQKFGLFGDYLKDRGNITESDYGRFNVTKKEEDRYTFKVPTLRNVELTAPYFHDGSAPTLETAVKVMVKYQLGREASTTDIDDIIKFLTTLTGKLEGVS